MTAALAAAPEATREPILHPVDRIMELLFGLLMALSFTGALSVAEAGREDLREMFIAALGCNLAWGFVDGVMYLIRTVVDRGRTLTLMRSVREAVDPQAGRAVIESALSRVAAGLVLPAEIEAVRGRVVALPAVPAAGQPQRQRPARRAGDLPAGGAGHVPGRPALRLHAGCRGGEEHLAHHCAGHALPRRASPSAAMPAMAPGAPGWR
jgi:hypothetical protein